MKKILIIIFGLIMAQNNEINSLSEQLKPFENYIGKTFKGEFSHSTPDKPVFDVQHWEKFLNGKGIRITHSVNDGEYGGESIIMWDAEAGSLKSWYFTTAGFYTQAAVVIEGDKISYIEKVVGNANGITEVKSIVQLQPNGDVQTKTQYFQNEKWVDGHEIYYKEIVKEELIDSSNIESKVVGIGGVFFKTDNPEKTKKWYQENLGFPIDEWGTMFKSRDIDNPDLLTYLQWSPFDEKTDYFDPSKKDFMINYRVQNIEELVKILKEKGVTVLDEITEYGEIGKFVHILDPEDNKIELWEPPKSSK